MRYHSEPQDIRNTLTRSTFDSEQWQKRKYPCQGIEQVQNRETRTEIPSTANLELIRLELVSALPLSAPPPAPWRGWLPDPSVLSLVLSRAAWSAVWREKPLPNRLTPLLKRPTGK